MRRTRTAWATVKLVLTLMAAGCTVPGPEDGIKGWSIRVAAASDLQATLPEIVAAFRAENPHDRVEVVYGSSGQLAQQIEAGAPFDLFLSANERLVRDLDTKGLLQRPVQPYAIGALALAVGRNARAGVAGLADLSRQEVKAIAIASPEVAPYGHAARTALQRAGVWEAVKAKVVQAQSVRQALQFVETGNAEAGLVSKATGEVEGVRFLPVDPALYDPIVQSLGVVRIQGDNDLVDRFVRFMVGEKGRSILVGHGFRLPPTASGPGA
jgi:molybdate transport system substrate-binding protein